MDNEVFHRADPRNFDLRAAIELRLVHVALGFSLKLLSVSLHLGVMRLLRRVRAFGLLLLLLCGVGVIILNALEAHCLDQPLQLLVDVFLGQQRALHPALQLDDFLVQIEQGMQLADLLIAVARSQPYSNAHIVAGFPLAGVHLHPLPAQPDDLFLIAVTAHQPEHLFENALHPAFGELPRDQFLPLHTGVLDDRNPRRRLVQRIGVHALIVAGDSGAGLPHTIEAFDHRHRLLDHPLSARGHFADHANRFDADHPANLRVEQILDIHLSINNLALRTVRQIQRVHRLADQRRLLHLDIARYVENRHPDQLVGNRYRRPCFIGVVVGFLVEQDFIAQRRHEHLAPAERTNALIITTDIAFIDRHQPSDVVLVIQLLAVALVELETVVLVIGRAVATFQRHDLLFRQAHRDEITDRLGRAVA